MLVYLELFNFKKKQQKYLHISMFRNIFSKKNNSKNIFILVYLEIFFQKKTKKQYKHLHISIFRSISFKKHIKKYIKKSSYEYF